MFDKVSHHAGWLADPLLLAGVLIVTGFVVIGAGFRGRPVARFVSQVIFFLLLTFLLVRAGITLDTPTPPEAEAAERLLITIYKVIWWLAAAWLLSGFFRAFVTFGRQPGETRFLQDVIAGVIYVGALFAIVAYGFGLPVSGVLATSGAIAIVLGLALQSTLGDLFSGVVLSFAKPFHTDDWIILDQETQGKVIETNWRATHVLTPNNDLAIIPNSVIAKAKLTNVSSPSKAHGLSILVQVEPTIAPASICAVLEAALLSSNRILHTPRPTVTIKSLNAAAMECELGFLVPDISATSDAQNELFDLVHRHCASAGLRFASPAVNLCTPRRAEVEQISNDGPQELLSRVPVLASLTEDERAALVGKLRRRSFKPGDTLLEPGVVPRTLSIVGSGVLLVTRREGAQDMELFRFGPGDCFGESGVLTGSPAHTKVSALTRGLIYEVPEDALTALLKQRPSISAELGQILARREVVGRERLTKHTNHEAPCESLAERLAQRITALFHLYDMR